MKTPPILTLLPFLFVACVTLTACSLFGSNNDTNRPNIPGKIVFAANDDEGTSQIFTMKANGSDLRQITNLENDEAYQPSWSPDGRQIVFSTSLQSSSNGFSLFIMDADGSNQHPMHDRPGSPIPTPGNDARWSPDGGKIAFDRCVNCQVGTNIQLFVYTFATDSVRQLSHTSYTTNSNPTWSPDGSKIAFASDRDYFDADTQRFRKDLYVINADGSNQQRLTETGNATRPAWSPDGNRIAYEWNIRENEVYLYNMSSDEIQNVETGFQFAGNPLWNNQGTQLLVFGRETEQAQSSMKYIDINTDPPEILHQIKPSENVIGTNYDWFIPN